MGKVSRVSKGKEVRPTFYVFCEGESEEVYISFIKTTHRIPIQIKSKVAKNKLNQKYVSRVLKLYQPHKKDKCFLMYDLDVPEMLNKLRAIRDSVLLVSNPCIELWYILHTCNHSYAASTHQCITQLEGICKGYKKGFICDKLKNELKTGEAKASSRAKKLTLYDNPSTSVFLLLDEINRV